MMHMRIDLFGGACHSEFLASFLYAFVSIFLVLSCHEDCLVSDFQAAQSKFNHD
jgi:hypothetical protein